MTQEENLFVPLCPSEDVEPGEEKVFRSNGRSVLVIRSAEGDLFAVEDNCPHANANISGGRFRGGFYACPHHGARFELSTGKSMTNLSNKPLVCFDIIEEDGQIKIFVPEKKKVKVNLGGMPPGFGPPM
jgi:nitrite reductase/ring-hydroxylating ferredoxin subunit